jgi:hypothetical protein
MTKLLWDGSEFRRTETPDLSTTLRSGRDDKGQDCCGMDRSSGEQKPQISPLRCAPVEMTKGRTVRAFNEFAAPHFKRCLERSEEVEEAAERVVSAGN